MNPRRTARAFAPAHPDLANAAGVPAQLANEKYVESLARIVYYWGYPAVDTFGRTSAWQLMKEPGATMGLFPGAPKNRLGYLDDYMPPSQRKVVTPNNDTIYGAGFADLTDEAVVIQTPTEVPAGHYWTIQIVDLFTTVTHQLGSASATPGGKFLLTGPNWAGETPEGFVDVLEGIHSLEYKVTPPEDRRYTYYPGTSEVPEASAARTLGSSFKILAELEFTKASVGVVVSQGSRFGGYTMFVKDGQLHFVYNFLGIPPEQKLHCPAPTSGKHVVGVEFAKSSVTEKLEVLGLMTLYVDDDAVATGDFRTQSGHYSLCGEGVAVGRDSADPVSTEYSPGIRLHRRSDLLGDLRRRRRRVHRPGAATRGDPGARLIFRVVQLPHAECGLVSRSRPVRRDGNPRSAEIWCATNRLHPAVSRSDG